MKGALLALLGVAAASASTCVELTIEDYGKVDIELTDDATPITVANFLSYVDDKGYDGTIFHRVIENFMIQGGGYTSSLKATSTSSPIKDEASTGLSNSYGTIAMARTSQADSATNQFFINTHDNSYLDYSSSSDGYCAFGTVTSGMDVVDSISEVATHTTSGMSDVPKTSVVIKKIRRTDCSS